MKFESQIHALLPMKGHSERVPNKNLRPFGGKPLYHAVLNVLLASPAVADVTINTDSDAIASDAAKLGPRVRVLRRPAEICGDFVSMNTIIRYDISQTPGEYFLQTHSTNPLMSTDTINRAIAEFFKPGPHDSLFGVNRLQTRLYDKDGKPINHNPNEMLRTQDLAPIYEENSNIYLFTRNSFNKKGLRIGESPILFETPKQESVDIDVEADFRLAEFIYQSRQTVGAR